MHGRRPSQCAEHLVDSPVPITRGHDDDELVGLVVAQQTRGGLWQRQVHADSEHRNDPVTRPFPDSGGRLRLHEPGAGYEEGDR